MYLMWKIKLNGFHVVNEKFSCKLTVYEKGFLCIYVRRSLIAYNSSLEMHEMCNLKTDYAHSRR